MTSGTLFILCILFQVVNKLDYDTMYSTGLVYRKLKIIYIFFVRYKKG